MKANSLRPVLDTMFQNGTGFEINTMEELSRLGKLGDLRPNIINSSTVLSATDIRGFYHRGVRQFCADRRSQLTNLGINAPGAEVLIRLKVPEAGSRFAVNSRFGAKPDQVSELISYAEEVALRVNGLHFHVGSQCSNSENWKSGIQMAADWFTQHPQLKILNVGGGLPSTENGDSTLITEILGAIQQTVETVFDRPPELYIESGRFLVANSAVLGSSVIQLEAGAELSIATLDISVFSGLLEIFESKLAMEYPVWSDGDGPLSTYRLEGPTCAGNDVLSRPVNLSELVVDYRSGVPCTKVYFGNTGAYSIDYVRGIQSGFNGSRIPSILTLKDSKVTKFG
ncbi:MAG: hypothetical protein L3J79_02995 [Candidatus Marinimicrobia bacterium]|nr:hypothetical protein [Candidatus Neomarinimicrobiota bacterium]